jgi:hypothetical protein
MEIGESVKVAPSSGPASDESASKEPDWLEIELLDAGGEPMKDQPYLVELRDGGTRDGKLDGSGRARLDRVKPGAHRVSFPDLPDDHWVGGATRKKGPKQAVVMTGRPKRLTMAPRIECTFRCDKVASKDLTTKVVPVHFCHVHLFYEKWGKDGKKVLCEDALTFAAGEEKRAALADDGKCDHKLVQGATYHCYFAGKKLGRAEIDALLGERRRLLIEVKAQKEIVIGPHEGAKALLRHPGLGPPHRPRPGAPAVRLEHERRSRHRARPRAPPHRPRSGPHLQGERRRHFRARPPSLVFNG